MARDGDDVVGLVVPELNQVFRQGHAVKDGEDLHTPVECQELIRLGRDLRCKLAGRKNHKVRDLARCCSMRMSIIMYWITLVSASLSEQALAEGWRGTVGLGAAGGWGNG